MSIQEIAEEELGKDVADLKKVGDGWLVLCCDGSLVMFTAIIECDDTYFRIFGKR